MISVVSLPAALLALALLWVPAVQAQRPAQTAPAAPAVAPPAEYRLGTGDVIRIAVFQNADLTLETRITEAGVVSYPLLGVVRLGGLSVTEAEKHIADGLRNGNFVKNPQVTLVVLQVRGSQVSVLGQVNRPEGSGARATSRGLPRPRASHDHRAQRTTEATRSRGAPPDGGSRSPRPAGRRPHRR